MTVKGRPDLEVPKGFKEKPDLEGERVCNPFGVSCLFGKLGRTASLADWDGCAHMREA